MEDKIKDKMQNKLAADITVKSRKTFKVNYYPSIKFTLTDSELPYKAKIKVVYIHLQCSKETPSKLCIGWRGIATVSPLLSNIYQYKSIHLTHNKLRVSQNKFLCDNLYLKIAYKVTCSPYCFYNKDGRDFVRRTRYFLNPEPPGCRFKKVQNLLRFFRVCCAYLNLASSIQIFSLIWVEKLTKITL
jgi:hypothetical protein